MSLAIHTYTGGIFDTNAFFLPESGTLIDAPQGVAAWLTEQGHKVQWLLLTHGHIDHTWDAAQVQRQHGAQVLCHGETVPMVTDRNFFKDFGFGWEVEPVKVDRLLDEGPGVEIGALTWDILLVPGHCPGSLCFYRAAEQLLFGGDVLFAGSIGRCDLPGGDFALLEAGIRSKLYRLPDDVTVLPGHGPATKIGLEKQSNPFVSERS